MTSGTASASPLTPDERFARPAGEDALRRAEAARARVRDLLPEGASVFTAASETLRLSGIDDDLNASGRYEAVKPRLLAMDRTTQRDEMRLLVSTPDVVIGSVVAVTETGSLLAASATGSQIPAYSGGAAMRVWIAGSQKVVPDLNAALCRLETYALPMEDARARAVYGTPSAANEVLIVNGSHLVSQGVVLLLRQPFGY